MNLERPIVFLDFETTGVDPFVDRAVSLAMIRYEPGGEPQPYNQMFNPEQRIPPESTETHGITDEMVKDMPTFFSVAREILPFFEDADIGGYNVRRFDLPLLVTEFERAGITFPWRERFIIDPFVIFKKKEPRDLTAALKFYTGETMENAHNALADIAATVLVLNGQLQRYKDLGEMSTGQIHDFIVEGETSIDLAGKLARNKSGEAIYTFGKCRGERVLDDQSFAHWMLRNDFPQDTKRCLQHILENEKTRQPTKKQTAINETSQLL